MERPLRNSNRRTGNGWSLSQGLEFWSRRDLIAISHLVTVFSCTYSYCIEVTVCGVLISDFFDPSCAPVRVPMVLVRVYTTYSCLI